MYESILVPIDGSATSQLGLDEAIRVARAMGSTIHLLHIVDETSFASSFEATVALTAEVLQSLQSVGQKVLDDAQAYVRQAGIPVEGQVVESLSERVSDLVLRKAQEWGVQLVVLGTHGRRGVQRMLLGSDAEQIVRQATVPVLLVRGG